MSSTSASSAPAVRRVRVPEWERVRDLRIRALSDPNAHLAFLGDVAQARSESDEFWQERTARAAVGSFAAQFVAEADGRWFGTATVLLQPAGSHDEFGAARPADRLIIVGVYVDPEARGRGAIDALLQACAAWTAACGHTSMFLDVHRDNARAIAAYERFGFTSTGVEFTSIIGAEREMVYAL